MVKSYKEASKFPLVEMSGVAVPRLILGHLPFVGETYQGPRKNRECFERFSDLENTVRILAKTVEEYGMTVMSAMPAIEGKLASHLLEAIRETMRRTETEIALIPCLRIPLKLDGAPIDDYRRWLTYYYVERQLVGRKILKKYLEDPILRYRKEWAEKFSQVLTDAGPYQKETLEKLKIDYNTLRQALSSLQGFKILFIEPGSETDFLAMTGRLDLLYQLVDWLRNNFGYRILLGTHHAGSTIPILETSRIEFDGYVTPVNESGVMMFPTQMKVLETIKSIKRPVMAIKPLAGGRISPRRAFEFLFEGLGIDVCVIGVASEGEVDEDMSLALKILST
ncbi:MAG: hypothetical protein JSV75_03935 [Candidatus Bathyarchaeota archaeon]|nr:MAG: hypothetical protein JSV75_03935 [Candidatus Bathyarchaeota archaeon]